MSQLSLLCFIDETLGACADIVKPSVHPLSWNDRIDLGTWEMCRARARRWRVTPQAYLAKVDQKAIQKARTSPPTTRLRTYADYITTALQSAEDAFMAKHSHT